MNSTRHLYLRLVQEADAEFIVKLRANPKLNQYLNPVDVDLNKQREWLVQYKQNEAKGVDFYFVIVDKAQGDIGLIRVYDINYEAKTFIWGSWVITDENRPRYAALESALLSYDFAFNELGLNRARFCANNDNSRAINFYNRFGARLIGSDQDNSYFELTKTDYICLKYSRYIEFFIYLE